jgi:hypothetical protein
MTAVIVNVLNKPTTDKSHISNATVIAKKINSKLAVRDN